MAKQTDADTEPTYTQAQLKAAIAEGVKAALLQQPKQISEQAIMTPLERYRADRALSICTTSPHYAALVRGGYSQPVLFPTLNADAQEGMSGQFPENERSGAAVIYVSVADGDSILQPSCKNASGVGFFIADPKTLERGTELWIRKQFPDFHSNPNVTARQKREFLEDLWKTHPAKAWGAAPYFTWLRALSATQAGPKMVPRSLLSLVKAGRLEVIKLWALGEDGQHPATAEDMASVWTAPAMPLPDVEAWIAALRAERAAVSP
jgi:hypothetical protein